MQSNYCFWTPFHWFWLWTGRFKNVPCYSKVNREHMGLWQGREAERLQSWPLRYPFELGMKLPKGVNKPKTNRLLPLRPPHKDGQQILVSRFSKGWLKRLEGAQHKSGPRAVPEWGWTACQLGAPPCFHTQLQSSRIAEPGVHDLQIFIREEGVTAPRELEALRKKKRKKILKVCWVSKEAHASCCSTE